MSGDERKTEVLDLIINVLREHEKSLSEIVEELRDLVKEVRGIPNNLVKCQSWSEFKEKAKNAKIVTYQASRSSLVLVAVVEGQIYTYKLEFKEWLSEELGVSRERISG